jgi:hypothetical protein
MHVGPAQVYSAKESSSGTVTAVQVMSEQLTCAPFHISTDSARRAASFTEGSPKDF